MNYTEEFSAAFEELQKAIRDRSHLVKKVITDKNGHSRTVWVRPEDVREIKKRKNTIPDVDVKKGEKILEYIPNANLYVKLENIDGYGSHFKKTLVKPDGKAISNTQKNEIENFPPNHIETDVERTKRNIQNTKCFIADVDLTNYKYTDTGKDFYKKTVKIAIAANKNKDETLQEALKNVVGSHYLGGYSQRCRYKTITEISLDEYSKITNKKADEVANKAAVIARDFTVLSEEDNKNVDEKNRMEIIFPKFEIAKQQQRSFIESLHNEVFVETCIENKNHKKTFWQDKMRGDSIVFDNSLLMNETDKSYIDTMARDCNKTIGIYKAVLYVIQNGTPKFPDDNQKIKDWYNNHPDVDVASDDFVTKIYISKEKMK